MEFIPSGNVTDSQEKCIIVQPSTCRNDHTGDLLLEVHDGLFLLEGQRVFCLSRIFFAGVS